MIHHTEARPPTEVVVVVNNGGLDRIDGSTGATTSTPPITPSGESAVTVIVPTSVALVVILILTAAGLILYMVSDTF